MADESDLSADGHSDMQEISASDSSAPLIPPPQLSYPDKQSLMTAVQAHGKQHGYNVVVKTSSIPTDKKPGRAAKVWLRCDRGGKYRPRNGLTEATRKRKRTSRLIDCPFMVIGNGSSGVWNVEVIEPHHNHGPVTEQSRAIAHYKVKKGQVEAVPYDWPHDASFSPFTSALVIVDMQRDFCAPGGYLDHQGYDISPTQTLIPRIQHVLYAFRDAGFPVYHTREGHRPDLSTLSSRERFRSKNNATGLGIGSQGPLGRLLVRGEPGHDIVSELYPLDDEPVIDKPGHGAFAHTDFELLLRIRGIKNLVVAGVTTDVCVSTTIREANDRGFDCLLLEDGTAASDPNLHIGACESIKMEGGIFGAAAKLDNVIEAVENFKQQTVRSVSKSERMATPSMPHSPVTPGPVLSQSISTPLTAAMSTPMPMSPPAIMPTYISESLNTDTQRQ